VAPDGYGGRIRLILAVGADNRVIGVRVVGHKETPGLGDYIDPKKDRNKASPWIRQFDAKGFGEVAAADWKVKKDGGRFDARAGATISARAVTNAVRRALQFADRPARQAIQSSGTIRPAEGNPMSAFREIARNGIWKQNTSLVQLLGLCPLLAVSTTFVNGVSLAIATIFVMAWPAAWWPACAASSRTRSASRCSSSSSPPW
jgi:hypothetical protein